MTSSVDGQIFGRYLSSQAGKIFLLEFEATGASRGSVVIVPPFAEEMNRSRKMLSSQARMLARIGYRVLLPDMYGTGDSYGDFSDACWIQWKEDIRLAMSVASGGENKPATLLALRLGCLLAADVLRDEGMQVSSTIMWSPQLHGGQALDQFLRLRAMATMLKVPDSKETIDDLNRRIDAEGSVEVSGYSINRRLALQIRPLHLTDLMSRNMGKVYWLELTSNSSSKMPFAVRKAAENCKDISIELAQVVGPQFWSTSETVVADELLEMTTQILESRNG